MDITIIMKNGAQENFLLSQDAESKAEACEAICSKYTSDEIERIEIKYDSIDITTIDGKRTSEAGSLINVNTLDDLKVELGRYAG